MGSGKRRRDIQDAKKLASEPLNTDMWNDSITYLDVEPTSICQAACPMCARNVKGEGLNPYITLKSLNLNWFKNNITQEQIKQLNKIRFGGNVGDPAATPELLEIIRYLKEVKPNLVIGLNTNGALRNTEWWEQLGKLLNGPLDYCTFSIDGLEDTNHLYRRNVRWDLLIKNLKTYVSTGATAHCDTLIFEHNKHQIEDVKAFAKEMGITILNIKETDRWDTYSIDGLNPANEYDSPDYNSMQASCERDRDNSIYLDYLGKLWPCCHMAEAFLNKVGYELHKDLRQYNNEELFDVYSDKLNTDPFYICKRACNTQGGKLNQYKEQLRFR
jgi:hypothetical protein